MKVYKCLFCDNTTSEELGLGYNPPKPRYAGRSKVRRWYRNGFMEAGSYPAIEFVLCPEHVGMTGQAWAYLRRQRQEMVV